MIMKSLARVLSRLRTLKKRRRFYTPAAIFFDTVVPFKGGAQCKAEYFMWVHMSRGKSLVWNGGTSGLARRAYIVISLRFFVSGYLSTLHICCPITANLFNWGILDCFDKGLEGNFTKIWCWIPQNAKYLDGKRDLTATRDSGLTRIWARGAGFSWLSVGNSGSRKF